MGYTCALSLKKHRESVLCDGCLRFSIRRMLPTISAYFLASVCAQIEYGSFTGTEFENVFSKLLSFSAQGPYYFVRYYIIFTMLGPGILYIILKIRKCKKIKCIVYFSFVAIMFTVGYSLLGKVNCLGGSYLGVYVLGMIMGYEEYSFRRKRQWCVLGILMLTVGFYYTWLFYMNAIIGVVEPVGINRIFPKLRMNPPNMSICIYSMGVIILAYFLFNTLNNRYSRGMIYIGLQFWKILGKYSLDIFLWHILIQKVLEQQTSFDNVFIKSVVYYIFMLFLPVGGRKLWTMAKKDFYFVCQEKV